MNIKIGLIDVDGHNFPNLALMRISAYHKAHGDDVEWWWTDFIHYDVVYMSKIFSNAYSKDVPEPLNADKVVKGGTGYCISLGDLDPIVIRDVKGSSNIQEIKWNSITGDGGVEKRYIQIILKNVKLPLILSGKEQDMEVWFDALRRIIDPESIPDTAVSIDMIEKLEYVLELSEEKKYVLPEVPPPPPEVDF